MIDGLLTTGALPARDAIRATLQQILAPPVRAFDPSDMDSHGLGPPVAEAPREQVTVDRIASFVASSVGARPA